MNEFLKDMLERVIATVAEVMLGYCTMAETISQIDWRVAIGACSLAALITILKCIIKEFKEKESNEDWEENDD